MLNLDKSCAYIAGVSEDVKKEILECLNMGEGQFPFRYLRIPLHSKKLNSLECNLLVDKIVSKFKHWSSRFLSYDGKIELIRSVIGGITSFWA